MFLFCCDASERCLTRVPQPASVMEFTQHMDRWARLSLGFLALARCSCVLCLTFGRARRVWPSVLAHATACVAAGAGVPSPLASGT